MLASVNAMRTWRCYLKGASAENCTLVTDHNPNTYQPTKELHGRQVRWSEFFSRFTFTWQHRVGRLNVADPVSCRPHYAVQAILKPTGPGIAAITRRSAGASESAAPSGTQGACIRAPDYLDELAELVQEGHKCDAWFQSESNLKSLHLAHGFWWHGVRVVIPEHTDLRAKLLESHHDTPYSGHIGVNRTESLISRQYW